MREVKYGLDENEYIYEVHIIALSKKLFIETLGCAMNVRDSEHMIAELNQKEPYELTEELSKKLTLLLLILVQLEKNLWLNSFLK